MDIQQPDPTQAASDGAAFDQVINELSDWRGQTLRHIRTLINQADPKVIEETKWAKPSNPAGVPVWSHGGIICTGEVYKDKVKFTFAKGAAVPDPTAIFNASLEGNARRALDLFEGAKLDDEAFIALIRAAVAVNTTPKVKKAK